MKIDIYSKPQHIYTVSKKTENPTLIAYNTNSKRSNSAKFYNLTCGPILRISANFEACAKNM